MGCWVEVPPPWQAAFPQAWEAWRMGSVPIGAALADERGAVIAEGRSMQFEKQGAPGQIAWSKLSHAELNTLLQVSAHDHPNIRGCTLYTTMEPCPLCTGALVMSNVRNLFFAAKDALAGSVSLLAANAFNRSKGIHVTGPIPRLDVLATALHTDFYLRYAAPGPRTDFILETWKKDCPTGVRLGNLWFHGKTLEQYKSQGATIEKLMDEVDAACE